jgi:DNA polymerase (family 10)
MSLNAQVATILYEISEILTIKGDRFRSRAYSMASQRITALTEDIRDVAERGELEQIPGVGKSIAMTIEEFLDSGESTVLQELRESLPQGVPEMITLEGVGPKIAMRLHKELGVVGIKSLEEAARQHRIRELKGFGPKKEENILKAIEEHRSRSTRFLLGEVLPVIQGMLSYMRDCEAVRRVEMAGSARRRKETVGDLDVLVSSTDSETVTAHFVSMPPIERVLAQGPTKSTVVLKNMLQVDLRVIPPESYGAALQYFTGSKEHNVKLRTISVKAGFKLNEYGLFRRHNDELVEAEDEARIYEALGMRWMPPELRENTGEIEAAMEDRLPELVTLDDIRGDLHVHTDWSDGHASVAEMAEKAAEMDLKYIAITDHTKALGIAKGLDEKRLIKQIAEVRRVDEMHPDIRVLTGTECDIRRDGRLDISDEVLAELDWVVAAVHSGFRMDEQAMTSRVVKAIRNEHVDAVAHPTGRLIQRRSPYALDLDAVFEAAAERGVMMEINCYPERLDLSDVDSRRAKENGVMMTLGTDAHTPSELEFLPLGVAVARRGWLEAADVANTLNVEKLLNIRKA